MRALLIFLYAVVSSAPAYALDSVEDFFKYYKEKPPEGLVIEIVSGNYTLLNDLLPDLKKDIQNIKKRFPDMDIAIVTHGAEQFALTRNRKDSNKNAHEIVESLVSQDGVDVHVCGTYAEWKGVLPEDFSEYVDVAPAGPAQINYYLELEYEIITLP